MNEWTVTVVALGWLALIGWVTYLALKYDKVVRNRTDE